MLSTAFALLQSPTPTAAVPCQPSPCVPQLRARVLAERRRGQRSQGRLSAYLSAYTACSAVQCCASRAEQRTTSDATRRQHIDVQRAACNTHHCRPACLPLCADIGRQGPGPASRISFCHESRVESVVMVWPCWFCLTISSMRYRGGHADLSAVAHPLCDRVRTFGRIAGA